VSHGWERTIQLREVPIRPHRDDLGGEFSIRGPREEMIGVVKRNEGFWVRRRIKNLLCVLYRHNRVRWRMHDKKRWGKATDLAAQPLALNIREEFLAHLEWCSAEVDPGGPGCLDLVDLLLENPKDMSRVCWCPNRCNCAYFGDPLRRSEHCRSPKRMPNQEARCFETQAKEVSRCDKVINVRRECRVGKIAT
jgi:hypothetical protein